MFKAAWKEANFHRLSHIFCPCVYRHESFFPQCTGVILDSNCWTAKYAVSVYISLLQVFVITFDESLQKICVYLQISKVFSPLHISINPKSQVPVGLKRQAYMFEKYVEDCLLPWALWHTFIYTLSSPLITICCVGAGACSAWVMWVVSHIMICVLDSKCKSDSSWRWRI